MKPQYRQKTSAENHFISQSLYKTLFWLSRYRILLTRASIQHFCLTLFLLVAFVIVNYSGSNITCNKNNIYSSKPFRMGKRISLFSLILDFLSLVNYLELFVEMGKSQSRETPAVVNNTVEINIFVKELIMLVGILVIINLFHFLLWAYFKVIKRWEKNWAAKANMCKPKVEAKSCKLDMEASSAKPNAKTINSMLEWTRVLKVSIADQRMRNNASGCHIFTKSTQFSFYLGAAIEKDTTRKIINISKNHNFWFFLHCSYLQRSLFTNKCLK